jgi:hypothetical protein
VLQSQLFYRHHSIIIFGCYLIVVTHFWVPAQKKIQKNQKNICSKKIKKNNNSENRMPERPDNGQNLVEEVQKYKD